MLLYLVKYSTYKCHVLAFTDSANTATHIPSFTAPVYLVTGSYGGKILDSFSIKLLNQFTYLPETQAPGLYDQALSNNVAIFAASSTQAWVFELFSTLEHSIRKNSMLQSEVPSCDDAYGSASLIGKGLWSFTELCMLHTLDRPDLLCKCCRCCIWLLLINHKAQIWAFLSSCLVSMSDHP